MIRVIPEYFETVIEISEDQPVELVIENPKVFREFISDIYCQTQGKEGKVIISEDNAIKKISVFAELCISYPGITVEDKKISTKINSLLETEALNEENYIKTMELIGRVENYFSEMTALFPFEVLSGGLDTLSLIKACSFNACDNSYSLGEKLCNYLSVVSDLFGEKLFVLVNMEAYADEHEMNDFIDTCISHKYHVLLVSGWSNYRLKNIKKIVVDRDLCVI